MVIREMEEFLKNNVTEDYYDKIVDFTFGNKKYKAEVNFAYINTRFDIIFSKYNIHYDESYMLVEVMTYSNYVKYINSIIKKLYHSNNIDIINASAIIMDMLRIINKIINLFDSGRKLSIDMSLTSIAMATLQDKKLREFFSTQHVHDKMTPEEIVKIKSINEDKLKTLNVPGVSDLLNSGSGVRADQMLNIFSGLYLRTRTQNMDEITPVLIYDRWIDGLSNLDNLFIESNINRKSVILSKEYIRDGGTLLKQVAILTQDTEITKEDCGSKHYQTYFIKDKNELHKFEFKNMVLPDGTLKPISKQDTHLIGTLVRVRSLLKCATKHGVCATCYGSHARWNKSTPLYKRDVGIESKIFVANKSQSMLSHKHNATPKLIPFEFTQINLTTGELIEEPLFKREFSTIIFDKKYKLSFDTDDILNSTFSKNNSKPKLTYLDTEFGDWGIIRVSKIMLETKQQKIEVSFNSPIKIHDFHRFELPEVPQRIDIPKGTQIEYVIRNKSSVDGFNKVLDMYACNTNVKVKEKSARYVENIDKMMVLAEIALSDAHISSRELMVKNKIRDYKDSRLTPDWSKPDEPIYQILSLESAINALPSLSVKLGQGWIISRLTDEFYHTAKNMIPSSYDILFMGGDE